jgi:hypothetical protein
MNSQRKTNDRRIGPEDSLERDISHYTNEIKDILRTSIAPVNAKLKSPLAQTESIVGKSNPIETHLIEILIG